MSQLSGYTPLSPPPMKAALDERGGIMKLLYFRSKGEIKRDFWKLLEHRLDGQSRGRSSETLDGKIPGFPAKVEQRKNTFFMISP